MRYGRRCCDPAESLGEKYLIGRVFSYKDLKTLALKRATFTCCSDMAENWNECYLTDSFLTAWIARAASLSASFRYSLDNPRRQVVGLRNDLFVWQKSVHEQK
jgi:hypothetical protein